MKRTQVVLLVSALSACAGGPGAQRKAAWEEALPSARSMSAAPVDLRSFAGQGYRPEECERQARMFIAQSPDDAWRALKVCVKDPAFTQLSALLGEPWLELILAKDDAAQLIARIIANRGGSVEKDVQLLNQHRVPLFGFSAAIKQPDTFKGRMVLIRAKVSDMRTAGNTTTVKLAECSLAASDIDVAVGPKYKSSSSSQYSASSANKGSGSVQYDTTKYGSGSASGSYQSSGSYGATGSSEYTSQKFQTKWDNTSTETGREALARLPKPDPFLTPEKEFIVLARFDGTRPVAQGPNAASMGVLAVVAYYEPAALVVY